MTILKTIFATFMLASLLSACGDNSTTLNTDKTFKINSIFGLKLGTKGPGLPEGYLTNNKAFNFTPTTTHKYFNSYTFSVTPNSHLIYGIKVAGPKDLPTKVCMAQREQMIKETLTALGASPTFKIIENGSEWRLRENNQRSIIINCELSLTPTLRQLVMTYSDTALSKASYVEWSKHQDDITKPQ